MTTNESSRPADPGWPLPARAGIIAGLAVMYFLAAKAGLSLAFVNASTTAVWPPTGLSVAALLLLGWWAWPGVFLGAFAANAMTAGNTVTSLAIASGNTLEALAGAWLVTRFANGRRAMERFADVLRFILLAAVAAPLLSATIGSTSLLLYGFVSPAAYAPVWFTWWSGDAAGAFLVAPPILLWANQPRVVWTGARSRETLALGLILLACGFVVFTGGPFWGSPFLAILALPVVTWAALRLGSREASTATLALAALAIWRTLHGQGVFSGSDPNLGLLLLQGFLGVIGLTGLGLGALSAERNKAVKDLETAHAALQQRVVERTNALTASEGRFEGFMRNLPGFAWVKDERGAYVFANSAFADSVGRRPRDVVGTTDADLFPAEIAAEARANDEQVLRTRAPLRAVERQLVRGEVRASLVHKFPIVQPGSAECLVGGVAFDATARLRADQEVQRYAALVESSMDAIISKGLDGIVHTWNPGAEKIFGYKAYEMVGKSIRIIVPADRQTEQDALLERVRNGETVDQFESVRRRKDGSLVDVSITLSPLRDTAGRVIGATKITRDITERRRVEQERARARGQLRELEQLKQLASLKAQFLNAATHELNTPLTPLKTQLYILKTDPSSPLSESQKNSVAILERSVQRLSSLVDDLLQSARLQSNRLGIKRAPSDIARAAREASESFRAAAQQAGITLTIRAPNALEVPADGARIAQVLDNLLSNALKFTPRGGTISVEVWRDRDECLVAVHDSGVGMTGEQMARLFHPFVQVHDPTVVRVRGTGLGLYISRGIVELHEGRLWCESPGPGLGSSFLMALPLKAAPTLAQAQANVSAPEPSKASP